MVWNPGSSTLLYFVNSSPSRMNLPNEFYNSQSLRQTMSHVWPFVGLQSELVFCASKLRFLLRVVSSDDSLSSRLFHSLAASDVESIHLVWQCRLLDSSFETNFTSSIISSPYTSSISQVRKEILDLDFHQLLNEAVSHPSQRYVQTVAVSPNSSWPKVWDAALERDPFGTICSLAMLRLLSFSTFSDGLCPVSDCLHQFETEPLCVHFLSAHTSLSIIFINVEKARCTDCSVTIRLFTHGVPVWSHCA